MNTDLAAQHAINRLHHAGFNALNETEKTLATVWLFAAGVGNNGFAGYYSSNRGDTAFYAPAALRTIGANCLAEIADEANAVFGPGGPPANREARRALLRQLPASTKRTFAELEQHYYECEEDTDALAEQFLAHELSH